MLCRLYQHLSWVLLCFKAGSVARKTGNDLESLCNVESQESHRKSAWLQTLRLHPRWNRSNPTPLLAHTHGVSHCATHCATPSVRAKQHADNTNHHIVAPCLWQLEGRLLCSEQRASMAEMQRAYKRVWCSIPPENHYDEQLGPHTYTTTPEQWSFWLRLLRSWVRGQSSSGILDNLWQVQCRYSCVSIVSFW